MVDVVEDLHYPAYRPEGRRQKVHPPPLARGAHQDSMIRIRGSTATRGFRTSKASILAFSCLRRTTSGSSRTREITFSSAAVSGGSTSHPASYSAIMGDTSVK